ncbi:MAG: TraB/GumN family protein [Pseudomonadota bacterium]
MLCTLLYLAGGPAVAETALAAGVPKAAPAAAPPNRGALFKVEQGGHTLYLFGTIHVGMPDFYPLEPRVSAALEGAGVLALELDPLGDPAKIAKAVRQYGMVRSGPGAAAQIAPAFRPRLARLLKQYGIAPETSGPMKPWMLATLLAMSEFTTQGYQPRLAVDSFLSMQAHVRKIPVLELESMASQLALFDSMPAADQGRFLEESIVAIEDKDQAKEARQIVQAWASADQAAFEAVAGKAAADTSLSGRFTYEVLLQRRNGPLADGIAALLAREPSSMAAIGVLHLVGAGSVPALLAQRGLKVERVY